MRLAVANFNGRVAPRLEFTTEFDVFDIERGVVTGRSKVVFPFPNPDIPKKLKEEGVDIVICGGAHWQLLNLFRFFGIEVLWGQLGSVEEVVTAFLNESLPYPGPLPGGRGGGWGWRWRHGKKWKF